MDSGILFTGPAESMWEISRKYNGCQFIALKLELWYAEENNHLYTCTIGFKKM